MEITDYQIIRKHVIKLGKEDKVRQRAIQLQKELREPGCIVPYQDAYEMAYNEIVVDGNSFSF